MPVIINLAYEPTATPPVAQQNDIQYACTQWEIALTARGHNLTINVEVWATDMGATGLNGMCIPGIMQTPNSTLTRPQAKANAILAPNDPAIDLIIAIDSTTAWILGTPPVVPLGPGNYSLSTTFMHELCHGLGFLGLCNVDTTVVPSVGIYTDANLLLILNATVALMNPVIIIPPHFFPIVPVSGFAVITPFANLFHYVPPALNKGVAADDFTAFTTANDIVINTLHANYTILTGAPFQPFTTCDHITGANYLMNPTTMGQYYAAPDASSLNILGLIGW